MHISYLFVLLCATSASASYVTYSQSIGPYNTIWTWNSSAPIVRFVNTGQYNNSLLLWGLVTDGNVSQAVCMPSTFTRIVIDPRGCDNANPALATQNANCPATSYDATINIALLLAQWFLPGPGQYRFGPVLLPGTDGAFTDLNLLKAQGVALTTGTGYMCAIPSTIWVSIDMPQLTVTTTCTDLYSNSFSGRYEPNRNSPNESYQYTFERGDADTYQFFSLQRTSPNSIDFYLSLYVPNAPPTWLTRDTVQDFDEILYGYNYTLYYLNRSCTMLLNTLNSTRALQNPPLVDDLNYFLNLIPTSTYVTYACNYHEGCLLEDGSLCYDHTPDGEVGGGVSVAPSRELPS